MKRLIVLLILSLGWAGIASATLTCPSTITGISPSATSCWPMQEPSGTTITDTIDSNSGTISGTYTLNQAGGIACNGLTGTGCNITTPSTYATPQPMSVVVAFAGTGGGLIQLGSTSTLDPTTPYYMLYLDTYGRLTFGANNYGLFNTVQSTTAYNDGNEHIAMATIGAAGMKLYVDGKLVASRNAQLANYAAGYWFFGGTDTAGWPYAPPQQNFNGTLFYTAWWNGTQLTDTQGTAVTGPNATPITNIYATITGSIATLQQQTGYAYANQKVTFQVTNAGLPGCSSTVVIAPSTQSYKTDAQGNLPSGLQVQQGAHVNLFIGNSQPLALIIPCQSSVDLWTLIASQTDPASLVDAVAVAGPLFAGTTVTNPPTGTAGTATITAPAAFSQTQSATANVDVGTNGNVQQVVLSGNAMVNLTNFASGASFIMDITENGTGGFSPTFTVPVGWTLTWPGNGSQPAMPSTAANAHNLWQFVAISGTQLAGAPSSLSSGVFPLAATANFNNYSGININELQQSAPVLAAPNVSATCSGTCVTTYTYEVVCMGDNSSWSLPSPVGTGNNAASLDGSHFNTVTWTGNAACKNGYDVYGNVAGSLGFLHAEPSGTTTYVDNGADSPGAAPPLVSSMGSITGGSSLDSYSVNGVKNVKAFGAFGDGSHDDGIYANKALAAGGSVYFPAYALVAGVPTRQKYLINTPLNVTNRQGIRIFGDNLGETNVASPDQSSLLLCGTITTAPYCIDATGSNDVTFANLELNAAGSNPSTIGIQFARANAAPGLFSQHNRVQNIEINLGSNPAANGGNGTIGIYNWAAEIFQMDSPQLTGMDHGFWFTNDNDLSATSIYTTINTGSTAPCSGGACSATDVTWIGGSAQGEKGPAVMFGGTQEALITMINVYLPRDTGYSGGSQFLYPIKATELLSFTFTGDVENYHSFLDLLGYTSYDLDLYPHIGALSAGTGAGHDIITLEDNASHPTAIARSRIFPRVDNQSVGVSVVAEAGANTSGLQDSIIYMPPSTTLALSHGSDTGDVCYGSGTCTGVMSQLPSALAVGGGAPTVTSCGGGTAAVVAGSTDNRGTISTGSTPATACTLTFANTWPQAPFCEFHVNSTTATGVSSGAPSTTAVTLTFGSASTLSISYVCM